MVLTADFQATIDATHKRVQWLVLVNGVVTPCTEATVRYAVKNPIGSCTLSLPAPVPAHVTDNARVEVQAGYVGQVTTIFRGTIPNRRQGISSDGRRATLRAVSDGQRLAGRDYTDVVYKGPISLKALFQAMCKRRRVASYYSDETTAPNGTTVIRLGNTAAANERTVTVPRKTGNLQFLNDVANLFGYYVFDSPLGMRQQRVSGMPSAAEAITVTEAWNALRVESEHDISGLVNYWEVFGASYTADDGQEVAIRSIPATVPYDARLAPQGWARDEKSSDLLDTLALADIVRNVQEIDHSAPDVLVPWETHGAPHLLPGDVANVTSDTAGLAGLQWVMSVEHTINASGFRTYCEGWRGAGSALPAGKDCITTAIPGGPWHIGDEYVPWYAVPSPQGTEFRVRFTALEDYSNIAIRGRAHGCNSQLIGGKNTDLEVSKFEIWQGGKSVSSGTLPVLAEDYALQRPYSQDRWWSPITVPMSGSLEPGAAELVFIAGDTDDYEVKQLSITTCGVGQPVLGVGVT